MQLRVFSSALLAVTTLLAACTVPLSPAQENASPIAAEQQSSESNTLPNPAQTEPAQAEPVEEVAAPAVTANPLSPEQQQLLASLPSRGVAPELLNETWLNSNPLTLASLRGKVVMIKFWTFG